MKLKDSRGNDSTTLFFVSVSWVLIIFRFALANQDPLGWGAFPDFTGTEFAAAVAAVLGIWQVREYNDKKQEYFNADD